MAGYSRKTLNESRRACTNSGHLSAARDLLIIMVNTISSTPNNQES